MELFVCESENQKVLHLIIIFRKGLSFFQIFILEFEGHFMIEIDINFFFRRSSGFGVSD